MTELTGDTNGRLVSFSEQIEEDIDLICKYYHENLDVKEVLDVILKNRPS
ncbi:hypothetical protein [Brevibacillus laterosporus]|uniref:Uncharacterized protein n=1 Tax=Brevibacillus laterosporus TaxID=1465 RepID=A0AAP3GC68_BRELA|nr:hypothetical protein [Brevibacillus laterosporus]MCR8980940.1 hypothetical protein [Brevibacillus laterosporus]MCZ0808095.1 hypothetical protein [Brevibacillus laterosporus]MCZ0826287.1 hypothetical protein [Brevibacillus laterosporus]MCZ0850170.1 hypothetical protein [Brevibacillus laterosporus]